MTQLTHRSILCLALALLPAAPVFAVDGIIEINQARALAGGVTSGDTPGFPVTIDQPGSYRLTSELVSPTTGIGIRSSDVTLDLGGFTVRSTGGGDGVDIRGAFQAIVLRNGVIRGFNSGLYADTAVIELQVLGVTASDNTFGLASHARSTVFRDCVVLNNASDGVVSNGRSAVVRDCVAQNNGRDGISLYGADVGTYLVEGSFARGNARNGFLLTEGIITRSVATRNTSLGLSNWGGAWGVLGFHGNSFTSNNGGNANPQVDSTAIELGPNICGTNATCP